MVVDGPVVALSGESRDAANDLPTRVEGGFDEDGYFLLGYFQGRPDFYKD